MATLVVSGSLNKKQPYRNKFSFFLVPRNGVVLRTTLVTSLALASDKVSILLQVKQRKKNPSDGTTFVKFVPKAHFFLLTRTATHHYSFVMRVTLAH